MTVYQEKIKGTNKFRRSAKELRKFVEENNIKLLGLLEYIRRRNDKKIKKEIMSKCQK